MITLFLLPIIFFWDKQHMFIPDARCKQDPVREKSSEYMEIDLKDHQYLIHYRHNHIGRLPHSYLHQLPNSKAYSFKRVRPKYAKRTII